MESKKYESILNTFKNEFSKRQQIEFLTDVLNMEYTTLTRYRLIKILCEEVE